MPKVPLRSVGPSAPKEDVESPPHKKIKLRVVAALEFDDEVDVHEFFHPQDYKGSESWDDFITGSIADAVGNSYDEAVGIEDVARWINGWYMTDDTIETIDIEWEWVK